MLIEAEAIPYQPALLRGERLLVLAPHPDDEVIGCGGLVALHLREGRRVRVVVATDGTEAGDGAVREEESRRALARLGTAEIAFLRHRDRALDDSAAEAIAGELRSFRPDLILVPAPIEIHPDHLALSRIFCELIQRDESLWATLAVARVAFYEVGQPLRPNALVDISEVADAKFAAIAEHASQLAVRDYVGYARGLNTYRAMTLPEGTTYAEAYYVIDLPALRTTPFSRLRTMTGAPRELPTVRERPPVSVVIRTKDRPQLLKESIDSVLATGYPCEIVVVNDGGATPEVPGQVRLVSHAVSKGRAEAGNAGVRAAQHPLIAFLDDDDLFYPEHLDVLTAGAFPGHVARYTDALSVFLRVGANGTYEPHRKLRLFAHDYDRELLLVDNYIPLPTVLLERETFLDLGGFDPAFDLFEDWDFLIRLSQRGPMLRIPKVTCEIRHFEGGSSIVLAAPEGSERFRNAKLAIWRKHSAEIGPDLFANVLEREKQHHLRIYAAAIESEGRASQLERDRQQTERDMQQTRREMNDLRNESNGHMLRVRELEGALQMLQGLVPELERRVAQVEGLSRDNDALRREIERLQQIIDNSQTEIGRTHVEIARLNGLLDMIYGSKSWKLHLLMEKMRGRG